MLVRSGSTIGFSDSVVFDGYAVLYPLLLDITAHNDRRMWVVSS
jgi:hypothetical protein